MASASKAHSPAALAAPVRLYRMVTPDHLCPYGLKALELLQAQGIAFEDHPLETAAAVEAFKRQHGVAATPQIFAAEERIGGYTDLARRLGVTPEKSGERSYRAVVAVFGTALLVAVAADLGVAGFRVVAGFMGVALAFLACLKLMDPGAFRTTFRKYDRLSQQWSRYGHLYPWLELLVGLGILSRLGALPVGVLAIAMGLEGGFSVIKAVYVDKLDLDCACVGGNTRTPLGAVSVLENLMMVLMGVSLLLVARA